MLGIKLEAKDTINILNIIGLDFSDIENNLKEIEFKRPDNAEEEVHNRVAKTQFPYFNVNFYNFILENKRLPTQEEFFDYYIELNKFKSIKFNNSVTSILKLDDEYLEALKIRLYKRVYPSLIRDLHFNLMLQDYTLFDVNFNLYYDSFEGIDSAISGVNLRNNYGVSLYLDTKNSRGFREKKHKYRHDYKNNEFVNIEYPIYPFGGDEGQKINNFYLYSVKEVRELEAEIYTIEAESTNSKFGC